MVEHTTARGSVQALAYTALMATRADRKEQLALDLLRRWLTGELASEAAKPCVRVAEPGRPRQPVLVKARELEQRSLHTRVGHAAFMHALAHIEFNAINLALDAVYRFSGMPGQYYTDWLIIALEEALHHRLLVTHLQSLGYRYGDFPAHNGLWDMAVRTEGDVLLRMALIPRVFEARGLDVTPPMIERLERVGDNEGAKILQRILADEVGHVAAGDHWFRWLCRQRELDAEIEFKRLTDYYLPGRVRGPFNYAARLMAGFSSSELEQFEACQTP